MRRIPIVMLLLVVLPVLAAEEESVTPDQLWNALLQGNKQFVSGTISYDRLVEERQMFRGAQMPPVTVLSCSDSRVPPELAFNQTLGALFVVRSAGNTADDYGIASIEYAITHGWTRLLVVLAHERCGAVTACLAKGDPDTPSLRALATRIRASFTGIAYDSTDENNVRKAEEANARAAATHLLAASTVIRNAVTAGTVKIIVAHYDLDTGAIRRLDSSD